MPSEGKRHPAYLLYRSGAAIASAVPERLLFPAAEGVGWLAARLNRKRRTVVRRNLRRVVAPGELDACIDRAFRSYARYWIETLRIPKPGMERIRRRTSVEGLENMARHLDAGQGVIFVTGHVGSWDVAGGWLASHGWRVMAIAESLEPPELFDMFARLRRAVGIEVFPLGQASSARALISGLREGAAVGLLADRDISGSGVEVEFFGEKTMLPTGPAVLAMRVGVPIAVGGLFQRPGRKYHGVVLDPIPVEKTKTTPDEIRALTQRIAHDLERLIRHDPGQWHLFQPNWPSDPGYRHAT